MFRISSFTMPPCQQSAMNYWMAALRVTLGLLSGLMLYLLIRHPISHGVVAASGWSDWQGAALIGFLGGFAERLVPTMFQQAAQSFENQGGTPSQDARNRFPTEGSAKEGFAAQ